MKDDYWRMKLVELREKRKLTQAELAKLSGVTQGQIGHLETGRRPFTQKGLDKILKALKANYWDIFCPVDQEELTEYITKRKRLSDERGFDPAKVRRFPGDVERILQKKRS